MKKFFFLVLFIMCVCLIGGCKSDKKDSKTDNEYEVYYLDKDKITLVTESYVATKKVTIDLVNELLEVLTNPSDKEHNTVYQKNVTVLETVVDEKVAYVHFTDGYLEMSTVQEVLFRTAVVKTLGQVPGIEYVSFYVREQPLTNASGKVVGLMAAGDFIDNLYDNIEEVQFATVNLYFADSSGLKLVAEEREVPIKNNVSKEQAVIENLISGAKNSSSKNTLPKGLKVLGVSVKDGICYVNFDSTFLNTIVDVSADVTIYSIVNTLCELPNIKKVKILVEGSSDKNFRDKYQLTTIFERNLDMLSPEE